MTIPEYTKETALVVPTPDTVALEPYWQTVLSQPSMKNVRLIVAVSGYGDPTYRYNLFLYDAVTGFRTENYPFAGTANEFLKFLPTLVALTSGNVAELATLIASYTIPVKDDKPPVKDDKPPKGQIPIPTV